MSQNNLVIKCSATEHGGHYLHIIEVGPFTSQV